MTTRTRTGIAILLITAMAGQGCASLNRTEEGALIGGAAGAAAGAVVGNNTGSTARGAILGAVLGGAAGAIIGRRMDQKADELDRQLENAEVERVGEGILITFESGILFDFDSAELRSAAVDNLVELATTLEDMEDDAVLMVAGHTDATGAADYNQRLSERRAAAARNFLISAGIPREQIETVGLGETEPVATNETEAGRQENRRVEVAIYASEDYQAEVLRRGGGS